MPKLPLQTLVKKFGENVIFYFFSHFIFSLGFGKGSENRGRRWWSISNISSLHRRSKACYPAEVGRRFIPPHLAGLLTGVDPSLRHSPPSFAGGALLLPRVLRSCAGAVSLRTSPELLRIAAVRSAGAAAVVKCRYRAAVAEESSVSIDTQLSVFLCGFSFF